MDKRGILNKLKQLYEESESFTDQDVTLISRWASAVDPLLSLISFSYSVEFSLCRSAGSRYHQYNIFHMREILFTAINKLEYEISSSEDGVQQQYYGENSQYDLQERVSEIVKTAKISIWIYDSYVDESIFVELSAVEHIEIRILTQVIKNKKIFLRRFESFKKKHLEGKIQIRISNNSHDRFIIVDKKKAWNSGSSLKDVGGKATTLSSIILEDDLQKLISDYDSWWKNSDDLETTGSNIDD